MKLINKIFNQNIICILLLILIIETFSLLSYYHPLLSGFYFLIILLILLIFSAYKLEFGLYFALIELFTGSQGYLFYLPLGDFKISFRLGIFIVIFLVWIFKHFNWKKYYQLLKTNRLWQSFLLFLIFIALGILNGLIQNNGFKNIFFDFNGYLYFGLFFLFWDLIKRKSQIINTLQVLFTALIYSSLKIFLTLYFFTHKFTNTSSFFYTWIRDTRVGEITWAGNGFYRIFFQSQLFSLISIFIISCLIIYLIKKSKNHSGKIFKLKKFWFLLGILTIIQTSILISFSRSYWLGGICGFIALYFYLIFIYKIKLNNILKIFSINLISGILGILLLLIIVNFPLPLSGGKFSASMLEDRLTTISGEAGASSRWNLLPILIKENRSNLLLGTGFGTAITYQTEDPRIKNENNPEGWYTTYSFEWGYLDTITEIGIIGLIVYLIFIGQIFWLGFKNLINKKSQLLNAGFLIGLIVLLVVHAFSPYLNHPLGIGYLLIALSVFQINKKGQVYKN